MRYCFVSAEGSVSMSIDCCGDGFTAGKAFDNILREVKHVLLTENTFDVILVLVSLAVGFVGMSLLIYYRQRKPCLLAHSSYSIGWGGSGGKAIQRKSSAQLLDTRSSSG